MGGTFRHAEFFAENGITEHLFAGEASPAGTFKRREAELVLAE
ncbi:MAG: hypothetical protein V8T87_04735 [Victivallales bacterium]